MLSHTPLHCHPRESGDPAPVLAANATVAPMGNDTSWIPAFAGMTGKEGRQS